MKRFFLLFSLLLCAATNEPAARIFKVHPLGFAELTLVADQARAIVGTDGRVTPDSTNNRLIVFATPAAQAQIAELIKELSVPPKNIQIEVRIADVNRQTDRGFGVTDLRGRVGGGRPIVAGRAAWQNEVSASSRNANQFITVSSGRQGWINVAEEVPFVDWFLEYGVRHAYLQAGIRWRNIGSRLIVEPRVVGDGHQVLVKFIPELTYLVDDRNVSTAFINASTEITVANGQEFRVGGLAQNNDFFTHFLTGYDRLRQQRAVDIVLKPTILP
jgi:type II secretory pathway component GspD/PulD (secretin)